MLLDEEGPSLSRHDTFEETSAALDVQFTNLFPIVAPSVLRNGLGTLGEEKTGSWADGRQPLPNR